MMPVEAAADWSSCAFSLICEEDGTDLGDGVVDDGELFSLYNAVDDEEEYVEQLVFKETSFCSSSDSAAEDDSEEEEDFRAPASKEWFRQARLAAVKWILEVSDCL